MVCIVYGCSIPLFTMDEILSVISNATGDAFTSFQTETEKSSEFLVEFINAVDWTQPWLIVLMVFHLSCTLFIVIARRHVFTLLVPLFAVLFVLCTPASYINEWAAENYKLFATEQYFDSSGMFISLLYSLPMMLNAILILIFMLVEIAQMVVTVKRAELRVKLQRQEKDAKRKQPQSKEKGDTRKQPESKKEN